MKKTILISCLAVATLASCSKTEDFAEPQSQKEIALTVSNDKLSRSPITTGKFADDQKIYVSAWNSVSGDYFKNVEFSQDGTETTKWKGDQIWPINGITSFLAYAYSPEYTPDPSTSQPTKVMDDETATWGIGESTPKTDWAKKLTFAFANSLCYAPISAAKEEKTELTGTMTPYVDLLYANADQAKEKKYDAVNMTFKHTGAWIVFNVKRAVNANVTSLIINNFKIKNIHKGGTLTIDNTITGGAVASWGFTETPADYAVESFPQAEGDNRAYGLKLATTDLTFGVIIPEQNQSAFEFQYTMFTPNNSPQTATYTYPLDRFQKWEMGKKYVYNITISFNEIEITPAVTNWNETSNNVAIPPTNN